MRPFLLYALLFCMPCCAIAQLENGSFAPDFELQDLQGNTWHLYELLEAGKHVILDFSATWCGPCWHYHETGLLNEAYTLYGPDGTDELMIFMIEGDDQTNVACLYDLPECSHSTQGDWTAGTLYPIINDDLIADAYKIRGWPTHFHICPTGLISRTHQPDLEAIDYFLHNCAEPVGQHNVSIAAYTSYAGEFCQSILITPVVEVQNLGQQNMERVTASCYVNGALRTMTTWEGNVIPFDTFHLSFPEIEIDEAATILVRIDSVNGTGDDDISNNEVSVQFTPTSASPENRLQLELKTNYYTKGVYWELTDSDSVVLYKGGNPAVLDEAQDGNTYLDSYAVYNISIPLPGDGCYAFTVYDTTGVNAGVDYYRITGPTGEVFAEAPYVSFNNRDLFNIHQAIHPISNNGAINNVHGLPEAFCSQQAYSFSIDLLNLGKASITQAEIELLENHQRLSFVQWTGDIQPGEQAAIAFPELLFHSGKDIEIRIVSINGSTDAYDYQNAWAIVLPHHSSNDAAIIMELKLDPWAYENYWQLANSAGDVLYSGGNIKVGPNGGGLLNAFSGDPGAYVGGALVEVELQLPEARECYSFLLVDSYGNGLYTGSHVTFYEKVTGSRIYHKAFTYSIPFDEEEVLIEVDPTTVSIPSTPALEALLVYPNPTDGELNVQIEATQAMPLDISIISSMGAPVRVWPEVVPDPGGYNYSIDLHDMAPGVYTLQVVSGGEHWVRKVVVVQ